MDRTNHIWRWLGVGYDAAARAWPDWSTFCQSHLFKQIMLIRFLVLLPRRISCSKWLTTIQWITHGASLMVWCEIHSQSLKQTDVMAYMIRVCTSIETARMGQLISTTRQRSLGLDQWRQIKHCKSWTHIHIMTMFVHLQSSIWIVTALIELEASWAPVFKAWLELVYSRTCLFTYLVIASNACVCSPSTFLVAILERK
jgi:hypothetical protein